MHLVISMFLSSNILLLMLLIILHIKDNFFSAHIRYNLLKISLLMAVIPLGYIKSLLMKILIQKTDMSLTIRGNLQTIMVTPNGLYPNKAYQYSVFIIGIWGFIAIIVFIRCALKQIKCRHYVLSISKESTAPEVISILIKHKKKLALKKQIKIYTCSEHIPSFTMGIIKPVIVIPQNENFCNLEFIIYHELCHIKQHDNLTRFIRLIVVGIYWFNPLVYILDSYLESSCEISCDQLVTKELSPAQRKKYANLIIDTAVLCNPTLTVHMIPFNLKKNNLEERIKLIMDKKNHTYRYAILVAIGLTVCSSFPVFAYQAPTKLVWENSTQEDIFLSSSNQSVDFEENTRNLRYSFDTRPILYDNQFIDNDGNIYEETENNSKAKCEHNYVDGTYQKHTKNSDGSCITKSYNAQRCSKCGTMRIGTLINEMKYTECPH